MELLLTTPTRPIVNERAQAERRELAECLHYLQFCRDTFVGFPSNEAHDALLEAEDEVLWARARLGEWQC